MTSSNKILVACLSLLLAGAGCFGGGSSSDVPLGVWKSIDGGANWTNVSAYPSSRGVGSINSVAVDVMAFDPQDRHALYMGSVDNGLFYTWDGAEGWSQVHESYLKEGRVRGVAVDPNDKCTIYVSRGQRLSKSEDCGRTFDTELYTDARTDFYITDVEVDWFNPSVIYITTSTGEVMKSADAGVSWFRAYEPKVQITDIMVDRADSRVVMIATSRRGIHRSADGGETWTQVLDDSRYDAFEGVKRVSHLAQDEGAERTWAATKYGLIVSNDRGQNWETVPLITPAGGVEITALAVNPQRGDHVIYAAGHTIYSTLDGGQTWETEKSPTRTVVGSLLIDPENSGVVYAGMGKIEQEQGNLIF